MDNSPSNHHEHQRGDEILEQDSVARLADPSLAETLKRIVRRVLRTQTCRTHFEARVLDEARRLLNGSFCDLARDTIERLVVDRLLVSCGGQQVELASQGAGRLCPPTMRVLSHSTFVPRLGAARPDHRKV
jgi:hypothetical protein